MTLKISTPRHLAAAALLSSAMALAACVPQEVITHGAIITADQIELIPIGSSRDQVLLALGTPSTTGSFDNEVFYYISQKKERRYAYQRPKLVDQRVLAVYFDENNTVARVADYGIQDGKVFDFISRTTPTGGRDLTFLGQILSGGPAGNKPGASGPPTFPGSRGRL